MLRTRFLAGALLACILSLASCGGDRPAAHSEQAQALLEQGRVDEALIELHNAFRLAPDNADYAQDIAELLMVKGKAADARFFYGEAYRLDPQRFEAAIRLAILQLSENAEESAKLIDEVSERGPQSAWGPIGRSEKALFELDVPAALEHARAAVAVEPENPDAHWQLSIATTASVQDWAVVGRAAPDELFETALGALDRFAELSPDRSWRAVAEKARIYTAWPGHSDEARAALRAASDRLGQLGLLRPEFAVLDRAIAFARAQSDTELEEWALERKIERIPEMYGAWDDLALLYDRTDRAASTVYQRLMEAFPDAVEPRLLRARHARNKSGRRHAIKLLERYIREGIYEPPLLAEIAKNQSLLGKRAASLRTIAKLEAKYPDARETAVMAAWGWLQSGRPDLAVDVLAELDWVDEDIAAQRVLVEAHSRLGDTRVTVEAIEHLLELMPEPDLPTRRRHAEALFDDHQYHAARDAYRELQQTAPLTEDERARYAIALFEANGHAVGRRMLERLVDEPNPPRLAVFGLYEREGALERNRERLRSGFQKLLAVTPHDPKVLTEFVRFEIEAGTPRNALENIERSVEVARAAGHSVPGALSLLARVQDAMGDRVAARATAIEVLDMVPTFPGALEFAQKLYATKAEADAGLVALTEGIANEDQPPQRHALLGRLHYKSGNAVMARWSYEQALTGGLELPILKNDLAFLLAKQKRDLKRARVLAMQAGQELPNEAGVRDTLGFVMLQLEDYASAEHHLRRGIALAKTNNSPQAELHYHLGLALVGLDRMNEAEAAFEASLEFGEDFPDEEAARKRLAQIRGEA